MSVGRRLFRLRNNKMYTLGSKKLYNDNATYNMIKNLLQRIYMVEIVFFKVEDYNNKKIQKGDMICQFQSMIKCIGHFLRV